MREDMLAAVGELKLVVLSLRVVGSILTYVLSNDSCLAAKVLYVAVIADYYQVTNTKCQWTVEAPCSSSILSWTFIIVSMAMAAVRSSS